MENHQQRPRRSISILVALSLTLVLSISQAPGLARQTLGAMTSTMDSITSTTLIPNAQPAALASSPALQAEALSVPQVVALVKDGVVQIITEGRYQSGTGSGFIFSDSGLIMTNNHVIEGASTITVVLADNRTVQATLVGSDAQSDIAVLDIDVDNLTSVTLGDSHALQPGEEVIAIGSALGLPGGPTITKGVVSGLNRVVSEPTGDPRSAWDDIALYDLIQTDAAINPGNSGGPLLNRAGAVIGVNTLAQRQTESGELVQGINYAISINTARAVAEELVALGRVTYPYLGIASTFLYPQVALRQQLPDVQGQYIETVAPASPADQGALQAGDIITAIDGTIITDESTFMRLLRAADPGDQINLTVYRAGRTFQRAVVLASHPAQQLP